ncbi:MAG TPA: beta-ketoacyl-[acyl-carrier-protein] synthase family protein [Ktedonobacteraceae bacterium]|nr:beta-ketoacyl-[acyl-carrier-protein] synthase family protein [Ktedonobacteraceae bacterium]
MTHNTKRRVVITGLGAIAANGIGKEKFWNATSKGIPGIKPIRRFSVENQPVQVAGEVADFIVNDYVDRKLANRTDRMTHFVLASISEALQDAGIVMAEENPQRVGAVIANTFGGIEFLLEQLHALYTRGPRFMSAYTAIAWLQVANVGQTSIRYGLQGYSKVPMNDTASGLDGLGMAYGAIQRGSADVIITGGCEALLHPFTLLLIASYGNYVRGNDPNAYRPFDRRAAGLIVAEGAGMCILEDYEHARRRGARIYGEIVGFGQTNDANGVAPPSSNGRQYARAISIAMQEADLRTEDIGYFSLDGQALHESDHGEADALRRVFGANLENLPVSVPRTMIGHSYAAAGVLDTIVALMALQHQMIPPTINCNQLDPAYELDMVRDEARPLSSSAVLLGARGVGGANVALALKKV